MYIGARLRNSMQRWEQRTRARNGAKDGIEAARPARGGVGLVRAHFERLGGGLD